MSQTIQWRGSQFSVAVSYDGKVAVTRSAVQQNGAVENPVYTASFRASFDSWFPLDERGFELIAKDPYLALLTVGSHCKDDSAGDFGFHLLNDEGKHLWSKSWNVHLFEVVPRGLLLVRSLSRDGYEPPLVNPPVELLLVEPTSCTILEKAQPSVPLELMISKSGKPANFLQVSLDSEKTRLLLSFGYDSKKDPTSFQYPLPFSLG